jgi:hypothetical protein
MLEKEINPLKRGRIQNLPRGQKKKSTPGEISDPFTVLNDSIAVKNHSPSGTANGRISPQSEVPNDHIAFPNEALNDHVSPKDEPYNDYVLSPERNDNAKTTTVDAADPLPDQDNPEESGAIAPNGGDNRPRNFRNNSRRNESHSNGSNRAFGDENRSSGGNRATGNENRGSRCEEWKEQPCPKSSCGIKCLWNKILSFFGFGAQQGKGHQQGKSCGCSKSYDREGNRPVSRHSNSRGGRNRPRPPQNNRFR